MKNLITFILLLLISAAGYAQKKPKLLPPPPISVPPPPKPMPSYEETRKLEADPLREHITTFWTDTLYAKTDSSFLVEQRYFSPSGFGTARLAKDVYAYPKQYTKDSLVQNGYRVLAPTMETHFQDGEYKYNKKLPKQAEQLIFTDKRTKQRTVFMIKWEGKGGNRKIAGLTDVTTKASWKPGDAPAIAPMGF